MINRKSNIELLRIIAMFMVLILHSNFKALGIPNVADFNSNPLWTTIECFIESFTIIAVNVFVMISGWFKIKPSLRGLSSFLFQCWFYSIGSYLVVVGLTKSSFSFENLYACISFKNDLWFVPSYIALYIISPFLNQFVANVTRQIYFKFLIAFFSVQSIAWLLLMDQFNNGYSCISFIGLYMLAAYLQKYKNNCRKGLIVYFICSIILFILLCLRFEGVVFIPGLWAYSNPLVIVSSAAFLMIFVNLKIRDNRIINYIAKSSFAVYLIHDNFFVSEYFTTVIRTLQSSSDVGKSLILIFNFLLIVFCSCIFLDQIRRLIWFLVGRYVCRILESIWSMILKYSYSISGS